MCINIERVVTELQKRAMSLDESDRTITEADVEQITENLRLTEHVVREEDMYDHELTEDKSSSFEDLKNTGFIKGTRKPKIVDGKYHSSYTGPAELLNYEDTKNSIETGKITANMPNRKTDESGKTYTRVYATYTNQGELIWLLRRLTRK